MDIRERLQQVFRDVFDDDTLVIEDQTVADDVDDWDSLAHIQLLLAVEKEFALKFSTLEVMRLKNVGEFVALISGKLAGHKNTD